MPAQFVLRVTPMSTARDPPVQITDFDDGFNETCTHNDSRSGAHSMRERVTSIFVYSIKGCSRMNPPFSDDPIIATNEVLPAAIPSLIDAAAATLDPNTSRRYLLRASALLRAKHGARIGAESARRSESRGGLLAWQLNRIVDYIDTHLADKITATDLAGLVEVSTALLATFADDALVNDRLQDYWGKVAIAEWAARDIIGARLTMYVVDVLEHHGHVVVTAHVDGGYEKRGLPCPLVLTFHFAPRGDQIVQLIILRNQAGI
jgi:hypothetical protein